ncbi:hypothetical protein KO527_10955 [Pseudoalteromonas sp. C2R02]|uniref:hypothetical protein n=1 Tax=Pseudoalteromonas sp. C2R02 TaxID=2841565 RepID=UPI001C098E77|nr:hypothetical protein [Pseudoalteromonas sp. C2R02]MBU2969866.1 hypothetical protein [Pseudoalteromonas sp. C2R02]
MNKEIKKESFIIFIIMMCLYLPFIESWFGETLWGLNWQSPMLMYQWRDNVRIVKIILVILAIALLSIKREVIRETLNNTIIKNAFLVSSYVVAAVQIPLLFLGIFFEGISSSDLSYIHKEKTFNNRTVYVYTADPGAMGKAYHYFYLKCPLPLNRFELKDIKKIGWMYEYDFEVQENNLIVIDKSEEGKLHSFDISNFTCDNQS